MNKIFNIEGPCICICLYIMGLFFWHEVEDIVDTGSTLSCLISHLESKGASSVSVCAFLDKPARRKVHFQLVGEGKFYRGFEVNIIKQFFFIFFW